MSLTIEIPKIFWKYYDFYRRKIITLEDFSIKTNISKEDILVYLEEISP